MHTWHQSSSHGGQAPGHWEGGCLSGHLLSCSGLSCPFQFLSFLLKLLRQFVVSPFSLSYLKKVPVRLHHPLLFSCLRLARLFETFPFLPPLCPSCCFLFHSVLKPQRTPGGCSPLGWRQWARSTCPWLWGRSRAGCSGRLRSPLMPFPPPVGGVPGLQHPQNPLPRPFVGKGPQKVIPCRVADPGWPLPYTAGLQLLHNQQPFFCCVSNQRTFDITVSRRSQ